MINSIVAYVLEMIAYDPKALRKVIDRLKEELKDLEDEN